VVAGFLFVATGIAFVVGGSLLFPNLLMDRLWELNKPARRDVRRYFKRRHPPRQLRSFSSSC